MTLRSFRRGALLLAAALPLLAAVPRTARAPRPPAASREDAFRANNRGVALLEQFRHEEAAAAFRKALALDPNLGLARLNLAIALLNVPRLPEARAEARAASALLPDKPQPPYVAGLAARGLGDAAEAAAAFRRVLELDGRDVGAHVNLGQLLMQEGKYAQAAVELRAAVESDPHNVTAAYNLALALSRGSQREEGERMMARFRELRESKAGTTLGQNYPDQGRYAEALASTGAEPALVDARVPPAHFADVTAQRMGQPVTATDVALADLDGDGALEVILCGAEGTRVYGTGPRWTARGTTTGALRAVGGDVDGDGRTDLLLLTARGLALALNRPAGLADATADSGLPPGDGPWATAALVDADHDGDLDVVVAGKGVRLFLNDGAAHFKDATAAAGLAAGAPVTAVVPTDFDNGRDIDLLLLADGAPPALWQNRRDGTFSEVAAQHGLKGAAAFRSLAAGDVNKDGFTDFYFGVSGAADQLALSDARGGYALKPAPDGATGALRAQVLDYDADGLLDVAALSARGPRLLRNVGRGFADVTRSAFPAAAGSWPSGEASPALASGDLDGDGDVDLVLVLPTGAVRILENQGGTGHTLPVRLAGRVSNRGGVGAKVEVRAGSLWQKLETYAAVPAPAPADVVFGLGARATADAVRVLWPSGTLQGELLEAPATGRRAAVEVKELDRKPSSCPYLYAWNGHAFGFVTDFMGGGEMGYWETPGVFNHPDPDEYVRLRADQLVAKDGRYELRVTNELEEALFFDHVALLAVPHPADLAVFPDEGMRSTPAAFRLFALRDVREVLGAFDEAGRDVLPRLRATDRTFVEGFALHRIRGYAEEHTLTLDLGPDAGDDAVLLLTGWTDYAFSSDNVAARQAGLEMAPPRLEVQDTGGAWRTALEDVGIPVGRPQTLALPLKGRWRSPSRRVRIVTNMRIYWDQAAVGRAVAFTPEPTRLLPGRADLRERGFSAPVSPDGRDPFGYDYQRVSPLSPWKVFPGRYTRTGDVLPLLAASDDVFVVSRPGDEVSLSFDAAALPPLPAGWTRTFLLYADGFSKEMDINSASPHQLEPLPYHGMPGYPYAPPASYPMTAERRALWERYATRVVRAPVASIDAVLASEAP